MRYAVFACIVGLVVAGFADLGVTTARAQEGAPGGGPSPNVPNGAPPSPGGSAALTPAEASASVKNSLAEAQRVALKGQKMLDTARSEKDIMRANGVNSKLTQIKALERVMKQSAETFEKTADASLANHELTKINVASQKIQQLSAELDALVGENFGPGESQVVVTEPSVVTDPDAVTANAQQPPSNQQNQQDQTNTTTTTTTVAVGTAITGSIIAAVIVSQQDDDKATSP